MKINVTLKGPLNRYFDGAKAKELSFSYGLTIEELIKKISLPREYVSIIAVNGTKVPLNYSLQNEDDVVIYPPVSGG